MPKYGLLKNGELLISDNILPNYKPIEYGEIPKDFNQETHYITQKLPSDEGDYIFIGVDIHELILDDEEFIEDFEPPF